MWVPFSEILKNKLIYGLCTVLDVSKAPELLTQLQTIRLQWNDESGSISFKVTTTSDTTYEEHDNDIITNDMDNGSAPGSLVVSNTFIDDSVVSTVTIDNTNNNEFDITPHKPTAEQGTKN